MRSTSGLQLIERFSNFFEEPFEEGTFLLKFSTLLLVVSWNLRVYLFFFFYLQIFTQWWKETMIGWKLKNFSYRVFDGIYESRMMLTHDPVEITRSTSRKKRNQWFSSIFGRWSSFTVRNFTSTFIQTFFLSNHFSSKPIASHKIYKIYYLFQKYHTIYFFRMFKI